MGRRPAGAVAETTVRIGVIPSLICAQAFIAQQMGLFSRRGIDAQVQIMNSGPAMAAAIAGGSLDVSLSEPIGLANARLHGLNFLYFASALETTPAYPQAGILVRADSGIDAAQSLQGKTIAVNAVNTISTVSLQSWVDEAGGDWRSLKFAEIPLPQMVQSVESGTVAAAFAPEPFFSVGRARGQKTIMFSPFRHAATYINNAWIGQEQWLNGNRDVVGRVASALREAAAYANSNRPAAASLIEAALKASEGSLRNLVTPAYFAESSIRPALIQPVLDAAAKYGALAKPIRADELIAKT